MKPTSGFFWIIALVAAIGTIFIACEGPTGPQGAMGPGGNPSPEWGMSGIEVASYPARRTFSIDDTIDLDGLQLTIVYANGLLRRRATPTDFEINFTVTYPETSQVGVFPVTITSNRYSSVTTSFTITVERTDPGHEGPYAGRLLIFQVGPSNVGGVGAIGRSFIELYNNTDADIILTNRFSLQYARGTSAAHPDFVAADGWGVIELYGTIPAGGSFLVVGDIASPTGRLQITSYDMFVEGFQLSNRTFKVALMSNQEPLTVSNPFLISGGAVADGFVDLLGARNADNLDEDQIDAYETAPSLTISRQASARRNSLIDSNNNSVDFRRRHFGNLSQSDFDHSRPRYSGDGAWVPTF